MFMLELLPLLLQLRSYSARMLVPLGLLLYTKVGYDKLYDVFPTSFSVLGTGT